MISANEALLIVDVQLDFLPGGALAVPDGDSVIPVLAACAKAFSSRDLTVIASRDWHPPDHCSFEQQGGPWPPHCVAGTPGAELHQDLDLPPDAIIVDKATTREKDCYSAFEGTDLDDDGADPLARRGRTQYRHGCPEERLRGHVDDRRHPRNRPG